MNLEKKIIKNIFCDFHHAGLLQSLILLFEGRMGANVYRPIGTEWHKKGYWKVYDHPATVQQYLGVGGATPDGSEQLNNVVWEQITNDHHMTAKPFPGIYHCKDIDSGNTNKAITLEGFWGQNIDIVIASIPQHIKPFRRLCNEHPNHPILIYQIGNAWNITPDQEAMVDMILASAKTGYTGNKPYIEYHQEFDLKVFHPDLSQEPSFKIASFVNCFNTDPLFRQDWETFLQIEYSFPEWEFNCYGGQGRDGCKHGNQEVAQSMREQTFIWHTKKGGDGYGHVIHNAFAVGRPPIVKMQYYENKMARSLMTDGETCISIDGLTIDEIINKINHFSQPQQYKKLCYAAYQAFLKNIDFDKEAMQINSALQEINRHAMIAS